MPTKEEIESVLQRIEDRGLVPDNRDRSVFIEKNGRKYPARYVYVTAAGAEAQDINTDTAKRELERLGFKIVSEDKSKEQENRNMGKSLEDYSNIIKESKNVIFHGAPGTGKTYMAKQVAAYIITKGRENNFDNLSDEEKDQIGFVQFHPSYDYTDFVEGIRPVGDGQEGKALGFELRAGSFKQFIEKASKNYEESKKTKNQIGTEIIVQNALKDFLSELDSKDKEFKTTKRETSFKITDWDDNHIKIYIETNPKMNEISIRIDEIRRMLESNEDFKSVSDIYKYFGRTGRHIQDSYTFAIYKEIKKKITNKSVEKVTIPEQKNYVFIIDEINRGEISKIFGELFFAIDPGYRGKKGSILTQYSNLHVDPNEKFYIPDNVYVIGTMNDIDRSVDSFDFAMRRRFRFIEVTAEDSAKAMLENNTEAKSHMTSLNRQIEETNELGKNYQIGAAYFPKFNEIGPDKLWEDYLMPLIQEYIRGLNYDITVFENAYRNGNNLIEDNNDSEG